MKDEAVQMLMRHPPAQWQEARRRLAVLAKYEALHEPTTADVQHAADALDLTARSFYRLLQSYRAGKAAVGSRRGTHSSMPQDTADVLDDTVSELGPEASDATVHAEAIRRCEVRGIAWPSLSAVRTRTGREAGRLDLGRRLARDCDLVLDACPLDLDVRSGVTVGGAVLTTLHASRDAAVLGHSLDIGFPDAQQLMKTVTTAASGLSARTGPTSSRPLRLVATREALRALLPLACDLDLRGIELDASVSTGLKIGAAAVPVLGRRLGRIPLAPLRNPNGRTGPTAPLELARRVVEELVRDVRLRGVGRGKDLRW